MKNICAVLNTANLYDLEELLEACYSFMDLNASEVVTSDCFTHLSQVKPKYIMTSIIRINWGKGVFGLAIC